MSRSERFEQKRGLARYGHAQQISITVFGSVSRSWKPWCLLAGSLKDVTCATIRRGLRSYSTFHPQVGLCEDWKCKSTLIREHIGTNIHNSAKVSGLLTSKRIAHALYSAYFDKRIQALSSDSDPNLRAEALNCDDYSKLSLPVCLGGTYFPEEHRRYHEAPFSLGHGEKLQRI